MFDEDTELPRLKTMCAGMLEMQSKPGKGKTAEMRLPKERGKA